MGCCWIVTLFHYNAGDTLAKPNYQYEKRQRDLAKKKKQEEKRQAALAKKNSPATNEGEES